MPTLSVIVPCYNHGRFLDEAVSSVLAQTFRDFEILVVDDGSTDGYTARLLDTYERPSTTVLRTPHVGKSAACNLGIRKAGGRHLLVLDADDRIGPTYAEKALRVLEERPEVGIVYCEAERIGKKSGPWNLPPYDPKAMLRRNLIFSAAFFRREGWEKAGGFAEGMTVLEDYDFWLSLIGQGWEVVRLPEVLFYYRAHWVRSRSRSKRATRMEEIEAADELYHRHAQLYAEHVDVLFDRIRSLQLEVLRLKEARPHRRLLRGLRSLGRPRSR
jgi:glycosyltransferase involved in cell wall biosynthesis